MKRLPTALRAWPWLAAAALALLVPGLAEGRFALGLLSQLGIAAILCLSYGLLMGQGGLLSFGHAVYSGAGAYAAMHLLRTVEAGLWLPVPVLPLAAAAAAALLAVPLGWLATRHGPASFAMVTLGLGELTAAVALMFPAVFGGESGLAGNRTVGPAWMDLGSPRTLCLLIGIYALASAACLWVYGRSSAGRLLQAVRDDAERVAFVGHDPRRVRWLAFVVAGFFAGLAGALGALQQEIVTPEVFSSQRSALVLVFTFLGGTASFGGPLIGAVLMVFGMGVLSAWTPAWLFYLGLVFLAGVLVAPAGVTGWLRAPRPGRPLPRVLRLGRGLAAVMAAVSVGALVEMAYQLRLADTLGSERVFLGLLLDAHAPGDWLGAASLALLASLAWWRLQRRGRVA